MWNLPLHEIYMVCIDLLVALRSLNGFMDVLLCQSCVKTVGFKNKRFIAVLNCKYCVICKKFET